VLLIIIGPFNFIRGAQHCENNNKETLVSFSCGRDTDKWQPLFFIWYIYMLCSPLTTLKLNFQKQFKHVSEIVFDNPKFRSNSNTFHLWRQL